MKARILASLRNPISGAFFYFPFITDRLEKIGNAGVSANIVGNLQGSDGLRSLPTEANSVITMLDYNLYTQNWTLEFYCTLTGTLPAVHMPFQWAGPIYTLIQANSTGNAALYGNSGSSLVINNFELGANVRKHIAVVYNGSTKMFSLYLNGLLFGSGLGGNSYVGDSTSLELGYIGASYISKKDHLIQHLAFTKAVKYTGNFTPPVA